MLDDKFKTFINEYLYEKLENLNITEHDKNTLVFEMQTDIEIDTEKTFERWLPHGNSKAV